MKFRSQHHCGDELEAGNMDARVATSKQHHRDTTIAVYRRAVTRVICHLRENLGEEHSLNDMAAVAMLSPFHFNRVFRELTGVPPVRFLYALRIAEAQRLLLTTSMKVIDVCYLVGYNSLGSFNNRFSALVGHSPRSIRKLACAADFAGLRKEIASGTRFNSEDLSGPSSLRGRIHVPDDFSGAILVALFRGTPSTSYPVAMTVAQDGVYALPPVQQTGNFFVMAVALSWQDRVEDFLIEPEILRAVLPPLRITPNGLDAPMDFILEPRCSTDPPVPPAFALHLAGMAQHLDAGSIFDLVIARQPQRIPSHPAGISVALGRA